MWRRVSSFEVMTGCEPIECRPWKACETRSRTIVGDPLREEKHKESREGIKRCIDLSDKGPFNEWKKENVNE
jgi:hypothetical protein